MIALAITVLAAIALAPLVMTLRRQASLHSRRDSALAVYRAQLVELDRDLREGQIQPAEHASAVLEVHRRVLRVADLPDGAAAPAERGPLLLALVLVPLVGLALYLIDGHPEMPAVPLAEQQAEADAQVQEAVVLVATLRQRLNQLDPKSEIARQGYVLLGNAEDSLGHTAEAATAWRVALAARFDPTMAAEAAEAQTRVDGYVSAASAALFRRALAAAPRDAPWRSLAEQRLAETGETTPPAPLATPPPATPAPATPAPAIPAPGR
jgi:cytochrome c-type biogenesis protein CcmH